MITVSTAVSQSFGRFTYAVLLTDIREELDISNTVAGSLGSANLVAYLLGSLCVSLAVGRLGLPTLARLGLAFVTVGLGLLAWSPTVTTVAIGLLVTGFAAAGVWVTAPALATAELGDAKRGTAIGIVIGGVGFGMIAASWLDAVFDWRRVYLIEAVVGAVAVVLMMLVLRRDPAPAPGSPGLGAIRVVPGWRPLLWSYGVFAAAMSLVVTFLVALLEDDAGYSSAEAAVAFSVLGLGTVVGGPLFGSLADRAGRRFALTAAFLSMAASGLVIATGHTPGATMAAFVFGTAFTGVPVAVGALISDYARDEAFGAAYGVATIAFGLGLTVGPQLGGIISDTAGSFRPAFAVSICSALVGAVLSRAATGDQTVGDR